jgi:hypothetical protein
MPRPAHHHHLCTGPDSEICMCGHDRTHHQDADCLRCLAPIPHAGSCQTCDCEVFVPREYIEILKHQYDAANSLN